MSILTQSVREIILKEHPNADAWFVIGKEERSEGNGSHHSLMLFNPKHGTYAVSKVNYDEYTLIELGRVVIHLRP